MNDRTYPNSSKAVDASTSGTKKSNLPAPKSEDSSKSQKKALADRSNEISENDSRRGSAKMLAPKLEIRPNKIRRLDNDKNASLSPIPRRTLGMRR